MERPYAKFHLLTIAKFALSLFARYSVEMCMTLILTFRIRLVQISIGKPRATFYVTSIGPAEKTTTKIL